MTTSVKKNSISLFILLIIGLRLTSIADEGMWIPLLLEKLNYAEMQKKGLKLTPQQLFSISNACIKDAVVMLDGGSCTGEIVSAQGLMLTNHHCGFGEIQAHSTLEHDYLTNGFWAKTHQEELPNPNKKVSFLIRIENLTDSIIPKLNYKMTEVVRDSIVNVISTRIKKRVTDSTSYEASVESLFEGNEYYLFVYQTFRDIRLVGTPPSSIGKYGGDTDNWMWPRHTGDFSVFRVYMGKDGKPADYSPDNIPYVPNYFLPISLKGIKENDFAMVWGYPGNTERYISSYGVDMALEQIDPAIVKIRAAKLDVLREDMNADKLVKIKYASKYAQMANYWKYFIGQSKGLRRLNVIEKKQKQELDFQKWVDADSSRKAKYDSVLTDFAKNYKILKNGNYELAYWYLIESTFAEGAEILPFAYKATDLITALRSKSELPEAIAKFRVEADAHFKDYNLETDKKILKKVIALYKNDVPAHLCPKLFMMIDKKYKGNVDEYVDKLFKKSIFASKETIDEFLKNPSERKLLKDPAFIAIYSYVYAYWDITKVRTEIEERLNHAKRLFIEGQREMQADKLFYPDANSTMRCSYGQIRDCYPADAVHYDFQTTLKGVIEKEDPTNEEFIVEKKLKELYKAKDYGQYGEGDNMPVCFLSTNDITGGNSGSPVMNKDGELIGLAFDGNWEAMSGDIAYEDKLQRTISVDIRYVLFIIDKYAGATNLIDEMKLMK